MPVFTPGASLPLAGTLPGLEATGLLDAVGKIYGTERAAFYSAIQLVLALAFATLLGAGRAEQRPADRPGLDGAPARP